MYDIIIRNGNIVDGSGKAAFKGDIAVKDGIIVKVAPCIEGEAAEIIDAAGHEVAPGFIDTHSHSDAAAIIGSDSCNYLQDGVTTQVAGQCGSSLTPVTDSLLKAYSEMIPEGKEDYVRQIADDPASFMESAEKVGKGTNYAFFIGHGQIRDRVMGYDPSEPSPEQMEAMKDWLRQAMDAGFLGFSSGLVYTPSVYAKTAELVELAKVLPEYGGIYVSHIRGEGLQEAAAIDELFEIGEKSGCKIWLSHFKVEGKANADMSVKVLKRMEEYNAKGGFVRADQYPYNAGAAGLIDQLPPKFIVGGKDAAIERLKDPEIRKQIEWSIFNETDEFESTIVLGGYENCLISGAPKTPQHVNKTIKQLADEQGKTPLDALCDFLIENDGQGDGIYFCQNNTDLVRIMAHPLVYCGSDVSDLPSCDYDPEQVGGNHPRGTGTMCRRIELVRDFRMRTMEECISNISYQPARDLGLENIGLLKEGWNADIVILDYDKVHATADYMHPLRPNRGIHTVIVNGKVSVRDGKTIPGVRAGKVLKLRKK
ncbi:MAG: D-aminoacylase [Firmicutes bacterium]|nr:D-aminoacylase [Bacillota bacterium]